MKNKGFTLFISIIIMGTLLLVAAGMVSLAVRQALITNASRESQLAFFAADSGVECALYWDVHNPGGTSAFNIGELSTVGEIYINEFSGLDTVDPLDQTNVTNGVSSGAENEFISGDSVVTTTANQLVFGHIEEVINGDALVGPGFIQATPAIAFNVEEYKIVSSAGSYNISGYLENPNNQNTNWYTAMATFKGAPSETITHVQGNSAQLWQPDPTLLEFDNPSTSGNLITVFVAYDNPTGTDKIYDVIDNKGNTYTRIMDMTVIEWPYGTHEAFEMWYAKDITGGGPPIEVKPTGPLFVPSDIECAGQTISTGSQMVQTNPEVPSRIGGGGIADPTSIFQLDFPNDTCAIVTVTKAIDGSSTSVESRGYNSCDSSNSRRVERAVRAVY